MAATFDLDRFIADCLAVAHDQAAVGEVVERAVRRPAAVQAVLGRTVGGDLGILHDSDELTIRHVVFPPGYRTGIHEHRVWEVIGIWDGIEHHFVYRRGDDGGLYYWPWGLEVVGMRYEVGDVVGLTEDTIHEVFSETGLPSAALHVYGGPLFDQHRPNGSGSPQRSG